MTTFVEYDRFEKHIKGGTYLHAVLGQILAIKRYLLLCQYGGY